ncbi:MAG: PEP-CTERM sorting domain-containing protein [Nitrosomonas sp.]|nr:PEP-CTERM sorting domain-containing protein [Nitrosomonas sp.]MDP1950888.1 PEP-CTERM sorting domain-containing protein [Nitrosomonas sp.]
METIKSQLNGSWTIKIFIAFVTINLFLGSASAAMVKTTIVGHIATVPTLLHSSGVAVNDPFELFFTFDASQGVATQVYVNGIGYYTVVTDTFSTGIADWSGSLPTYIASLNFGSLQDTQSGTKQSWYRPIDTLHHEDWYAWGLTMITNYHSNPVPSYGWFHYGQPDQIGLLIDSVVTSPVPEPESYAMMLAGVTALSMINIRRRKNT